MVEQSKNGVKVPQATAVLLKRLGEMTERLVATGVHRTEP